MFVALPESRRSVIIDLYNDSNNRIKDRINEFVEALIVKKTKLFLDHQGNWAMETPYYDENEQVIFLDEKEDDYEYAETWKHEVGHFIDHQMGWVSHGENFRFAKTADLEWFDRNRGMERAVDMLEDLKNSAAIENRYVSDILSALFYNRVPISVEIKKIYDCLGAAMYGHKETYWNENEGPDNAVESEIFADLFAIYTENNIDTVRFVEKWFPNITNRFKKDLSG